MPPRLALAPLLLTAVGVCSYSLPAPQHCARGRPCAARAALEPLNLEPDEQPAQKKEKTKRDRFELQFTCNMCNGRNVHSISRHAYTKGTVIVTCPSCNATHLVADNLNWIEDDFRNLEEYMEKRGTPVTKIADGDVAAAAASAAAANLPPLADAEPAAKPQSKPIDGVTDEQAARIREAVRAQKRRNRQD